jgi:hypothetical protein
MKKLTAIVAVLLVAAPGFAADWSFYGSERVATYYVSRDFGDSKNEVNGSSSDAGTQWYFQGNSRLGAKVKADKVTGQIELATQASSTDSAGDGGVNTRLAYGVWNFSDTSWLRVGKSYTPVSNFISNQFFDADNNLWGSGEFYGGRAQGLTLGVGSFQFALLTPQQGNTGGIGSSTSGILTPAVNKTTLAQSNATGDPDVYLPKFEGSYKLTLGSGYVYTFGGFQYYQVKSYTGSDVQDDIDIYSWVLGVGSKWDIGAFSLGGAVSYGRNTKISGWSSGYNSPNASLPILKTNGQNVADVYTLQAEIIPAFKLSDTLRLEAGFGYREDNAENAPGYSQKDGVWVAYVQALITLAPGVYLGPEIGYIDYMDDRAGDNQGYQWYAGAKWQIDF